VVELEDGEEEMEGKGGVGLELFVEGEEDFVVGDGEDLGAVEEAVGDDVVDLAGFGAEDAAKVSGLVAGEGGGGGGPGVGDPAAAGHESSLRAEWILTANRGRFGHNVGVLHCPFDALRLLRSGRDDGICGCVPKVS